MSRNLSSVTTQALLRQQTEQVFLLLVEIDHADLASPIRLVNNYESIVSNGETYVAAAFAFTPPVEEDGTIKNSRITFDNVDRAIVEAVRAISSPPTVDVSVIRAAAADTVEAGPWTFYLRAVNYDAHIVSGELYPDNPLRLVASNISYRNTTFAGLYG